MDVPGAPPNLRTHQRREAHGGDDGGRVYTASIDTHIPHYNEQRTSTNAVPLGARRKEKVRHHPSGDEHFNDLNTAHLQNREFDGSQGRQEEIHRNRTHHSIKNAAYVRSRSRSRTDNGSIPRRPSNSGHLSNRAVRHRSRSPSLHHGGHRYVPSSPGGLGNAEGNRILDGEAQSGDIAGRHKERQSPSIWGSSGMDAIPTGPRIPENPTILGGSPRRDMSTSPHHRGHQRRATPPKKKRRKGSRWGASEHEGYDWHPNKSPSRPNRDRHQNHELVNASTSQNTTSQRRPSSREPEIPRFYPTGIHSTVPAATATAVATVADHIPHAKEGATITVALSDRVRDSDNSLPSTAENTSTFKVKTGRSHSSGSHAGVHGGADQAEALLANMESKDGQSVKVQNPVPDPHPPAKSRVSSRPGKKSLITLDRSRDLSDLSKSLSSWSTTWSQDSFEESTLRVPSELPKPPSEPSVNPTQQSDLATRRGADVPAEQEPEVVLFRRRK